MSLVVVAAVFVAGTLATFTDWYFMGVLYHDRYGIYPETWWPAEGRNFKPILYSSALGYLTAAAVIALCAMAGVDNVWSGIKVAFIAWLSGSFVQVATTHIWVRIDWKVTIAHALGYLARFLIAGIAAGIALPHL